MLVKINGIELHKTQEFTSRAKMAKYLATILGLVYIKRSSYNTWIVFEIET